MPKYTSNFLEKVILRLDFDDVSFAKLNDYVEHIESVFDVNSAKNGFEGTINIDVTQGVVEQTKQELSVKEFTSTDKPNKKITLCQKWITLEYSSRSYTDSTELISDIDGFIQPFVEILGVKLINRVGLRYINQIVAPSNEAPLSWEEYIKPELVGSLSFAKSKEAAISRNFTQQFYKLPSADLVFSFGVWNDDFPNPIVSKTFILDYDCASTIPRETSDVTLRTEIKGYNEIVEEFFESSITQSLRDLMGVQE